MRRNATVAGLNFWSTRTTVCPETYIEVKADPGKGRRRPISARRQT
jgi:hypothetical protein